MIYFWTFFHFFCNFLWEPLGPWFLGATVGPYILTAAAANFWIKTSGESDATTAPVQQRRRSYLVRVCMSVLYILRQQAKWNDPYSVFFFYSSNKRSFRGTGGFRRGLNLGCWAKLCARELAYVASRCLQNASRGLLGLTIDIVIKFQIEHWEQNSNVFTTSNHTFQTRKDISAWLSNFLGMFASFVGVERSKRATKKTSALWFAAHISEMKQVQTPYVKNQGLPSAQLIIKIAS